MIDEARQSAVAELETVLLEAKLAVPRCRPGEVSRLGLIEQARSSRCRVVAVTAPAGYGKSTLLAQWAEADDRRVAWVSLDHLDDDPAGLLLVLDAAFARISGGEQVIAGVAGVGFSPLGRAAPRLAAALRASPVPFVLLVDDLQEIRSPECHDVLEVVLSGIPAGSQVVLASRSAQPHVARMGTTGDVIELGTADLAFTTADAQQIFAVARLPLSPEPAVALTARTEGWPVGLYLAALIAGESGGDVLAISGGDRYVSDYLYRESLVRLPAEVQHFLRCTAILDQLHAPLCDAVLGEPGSESRLQDLQETHQLLVQLDRQQLWFRYHGLFREFLLGELRRVEPDLIATLHQRAADWYEANGSLVPALEHLLETDQRDRCVRMAARLTLSTYQSGQRLTVRRWLATLGDAAVAGYPPLAVQAGWLAVLSGQATEAERWAAFLDTASHDHLPVDGTASFESARAMLRALLCRHGPEQMATDADVAVAAEPTWSHWKAVALVLSAEAQLLLGNRAQARRLFLETSAVSVAAGNVNNVILAAAELSLLAMDDRRWPEAAEHLDLALISMDRHQVHDYATSVMTFAAAARLAQHRGDLPEARRQLARAMRTRPAATFAMPAIAVRCRLQLAAVHVRMAEPTAARQLLREIDDLMIHRPDLGVLGQEVAELRRALDGTTEVAATGGIPLTPAELRVLPYLQTHLTFPQIADRLFVSRNTISSQVHSIYRKLGVSARSEAVTQATAAGLLGG